ncbi:MAG: zinc-dependent alcohol dehydrogenase [bacterium]
MKALFVKAPYKFEEREVDIPPLNGDEVLVDMGTCGVCGFDILVSSILAENFMPVGHEVSGTVVEVGKDVTNVSPGDRVALENSTFCGVCDRCKNGDVVHCTNLTHFLTPSGFAERIKLKARSVHKIGDMSFEAGALVEPLTVALDMVEAAEIPIGGNVVVFGPGPIGLMIARLAKLRGARRVFLTGNSHSKARFRAAEKLGADEIIYADKENIPEYFKGTVPDGVDRVLVTSPPRTIPDAVKIARFGGIIAYDGIKYGEDRMVTFDANEFHFKRLQLRGVHSIPNLMYPVAIDLLWRGVIDPEILVTHRFPLERAGEAIEFAARERDKVIKVMVTNK